MKSILILICLIGASICSLAQSKHEIKIDGLEIVYLNDVNIYYEYSNDLNGIETGISYGKNKVNILTSNFVTDLEKFDRTYFEWKLAYKRYVNRFFLGPIVMINYELKREEAYFDRFKELTGNDADVDKIGRIGAGLYFGYKRVYNNKFLIEPVISLDVDFHELNKTELVSLRGFIGFRIGLKL